MVVYALLCAAVWMFSRVSQCYKRTSHTSMLLRRILVTESLSMSAREEYSSIHACVRARGYMYFEAHGVIKSMVAESISGGQS